MEVVSVIEQAKERIAPFIESMGYEMVDVEYKNLYGTMTLTFFIHSDNEGGTSIEDCERVHHAIDELVDQLEIQGSFNLNVSSPGLDRPFVSKRDFERNLGKEIEIKLKKAIDKKNVVTGVLLSCDFSDSEYSLKVETKKGVTELNSSQIKKVTQLIKF